MELHPIPESPPMFNRLFIYLNAYKEGFKNGCRHMIDLDGCFLKGYCGNKFCLLLDRMQITNSMLLLILWLIQKPRTIENGSQDMYGWNFVSDQQKGLESSISE
ncbi:hypothetical protein Lal_00042697, partial [Lupinus albus]